MRTLVCDPTVEVIGASVRAFTENINADEFKVLLVEHKLEHIEDDAWYSMYDLLNLLNQLAQYPNWSENYIAMGMKRAEVAKMPPEAANMSFPEFLMRWNKIYQAQHRNADVGQLVAEKISDHHYQVTFNIIYPDDFIYGVAYGMAKRFLPKGTAFVVQYDTTEPRMDEGGHTTKLDLTWE